MIVEGKKIAFKNVVSKYYQFESIESEKITEDFMTLIDEKGLTPNGPIFYSVMSEFGAEPISAMYSIPIEENQLANINDEDLMFQTYFLVENMLMTRILVENKGQAQELAIKKYAELIEYTSENKMELTAPFHTMFKIVNEQLYLEIYLGATRIFQSERKMKSFFKKVKKQFLKGV
ncbi:MULTISPECIES: DUF5085 family protein [unclassified Enterococcus]|uniref:DUF5085 family protein n=1 Tax=unclassified Enterococcus TaxID=2608891 RepID=UPI001CE0984C|nr:MULTISPECIES: DUF5085 family protein [unclassified Enterococcus]MCA5014316.1 DUF5085 family protein [Enterococcus sp. S23]MCA5017727.1 DUF5085 family protein [Enterococcus sp. S22(2020)]